MENEKIIPPPSPAPVVEQTPPVSPTAPKKFNRIIIFLIFFVVIAIVGIGAYALGTKNQPKTPTSSPVAVIQPTPTPDLTANWKTYTDDKYKFSFKYPDSWVIKTLDSEQYLTTVELSPIENQEAPVWAMSIELSKQTYESEIKTQKVANGQEINVGGIKGLSGPYNTSPSGWTGKGIVMPYKQTALVILVQKEFEKSIDQILSTFKFL